LCEMYALMQCRAGLGDSLSKQFRCPTHPDRRCGTRPCGAQTVLACFRSGHAGQDAPKVSKGYPPALPSNISCTPKSSFSMCSYMSKAVTGYVLPEPSAARDGRSRAYRDVFTACSGSTYPVTAYTEAAHKETSPRLRPPRAEIGRAEGRVHRRYAWAPLTNTRMPPASLQPG